MGTLVILVRARLAMQGQAFRGLLPLLFVPLTQRPTTLAAAAAAVTSKLGLLRRPRLPRSVQTRRVFFILPHFLLYRLPSPLLVTLLQSNKDGHLGLR